MIYTFITILAWVLLVFSLLKIGLTIAGDIQYRGDKLRQLQDLTRGVRRVFPLRYWPWVALLSLAWLLARWLS